jgi:hypothetical protein
VTVRDATSSVALPTRNGRNHEPHRIDRSARDRARPSRHHRGVVCEFRLAVDGRPRLWIVVETWGQLAGRCAQHLHTGRQVAISGRLCHDEYVTRSGEKADRWYAKAHDVTFLDRPREEAK